MIWKLEGTFEIDQNWASGEKLVFRLEIFSRKSSNDVVIFRARQLRYDLFRVHPAFEKDPEFESAIHQWAIVHVDLDETPPDVIDIDQAVAWYVEKLNQQSG
jgi:hypothetical protein